MHRLGLAIIKQAMRDVVPHILSEMVAEQSLDFVGGIFPEESGYLWKVDQRAYSVLTN